MTFVKWNRKSVSVICRVTWFIIRPTIWNEFDIVCIKLWAFFSFFFFLQILDAISKVQLCCSIFSIKTFSKLVPSFGEVVWPFGNFFVSFLCLRLFNISSICSPDVFDPVKCKAQGFFCDCLSLLFIEISLSVLQCFSSSKFLTSLSSWEKPLRALVVFSCLYRSCSIFYPELIRV